MWESVKLQARTNFEEMVLSVVLCPNNLCRMLAEGLLFAQLNKL